MKNISVLIFVLMLLSFVSCSSEIGTKFTIRNDSAGDLYINFRGNLITVNSGGTSVITEVPVGTYSYSTTYEVPVGVTTSRTNGPVSGEIIVSPGSQILLYYTSLITGNEYILSATISYSDNLDPAGGSPFSP